MTQRAPLTALGPRRRRENWPAELFVEHLNADATTVGDHGARGEAGGAPSVGRSCRSSGPHASVTASGHRRHQLLDYLGEHRVVSGKSESKVQTNPPPPRCRVCRRTE